MLIGSFALFAFTKLIGICAYFHTIPIFPICPISLF